MAGTWSFSKFKSKAVLHFTKKKKKSVQLNMEAGKHAYQERQAESESLTHLFQISERTKTSKCTCQPKSKY